MSQSSPEEVGFGCIQNQASKASLIVSWAGVDESYGVGGELSNTKQRH